MFKINTKANTLESKQQPKLKSLIGGTEKDGKKIKTRALTKERSKAPKKQNP